jgi:hypothetical protein
MKKIFLILSLIVSLAFLPSCGKTDYEKTGYADKIESINAKKVDKVIITSGNDGGEGVITDRETIKELADAAVSLTFELNIDKSMTLAEMYTIKFIEKNKITHQLSMDKDGVFWFDDTPGCYEKTGGDIEYERIESLFYDNYVEEETEEATN